MNTKNVKSRGLGRGLSALMADVAPISENDVQNATRRPETTLPIEVIEANRDQPRRTFADEDLDDLVQSISAKGIIQPIIVRPHPTLNGRYQIVAGERRWRAAQKVPLHEVPVLVRDLDDSEMLELAIIENIQRADLNAIEEAAGYRQLMDKFGHTQEKLAEAMGKSRSHIANLLRLLNLPESVRAMVSDGRLSAGHARALVTSDNPEQLAKIVLEKGLSVRETEALAKKGLDPKPAIKNKKMPVSEKDADTRALEQDLSAALGMKVEINHVPGKDNGTVSISYATLDALDELCQKLSS